MKILHVADTHLGFSAYRKVTKDGINHREIDIYDVFKQFIDYAIKSKPDLILHAGDLFDSVRPNNRAITCALEQILRLSKAKIPIVIIAGNHEHPKLKETGHIFSIFDHIEHVYPVYNGQYEKHIFNIETNKIAIHCLPQTVTNKEFNSNLKKLKKDENSDLNILLAHGGVTGINIFTMNDFNEQIIPDEYLKKYFDYIALGHFHKHVKIGKNAYYSGSSDFFTFTEANEEKGFIEITIKNKDVKTSFKTFNTRVMVDTPSINCLILSINDIMKNIQKTITEINPEGKIFRITLDNIPLHIYRGIDFNLIKKWSKDSLHYELKANVIKEGEAKPQETSKIDALANEYNKYMIGLNIKEKKILLKLGLEYINKIVEKEET
jgi:DNA repair exonuclease SbcCD nuclease subunit